MMGRVYVRKFDWDEARLLRAAGATYVELAVRYGVSRSAVRLACDDGARDKNADAKDRQQRSGVCVVCGKTCSFNGTHLKREISKGRCQACAAAAKVTTATETELRCTCCREWKTDEEFPFNASESPHRRGRHGVCRQCQTIRRREYRRRNRDRENAADRARRQRRREMVS